MFEKFLTIGCQDNKLRRNTTLIHENFDCEIYFIRHGESESNALGDRTSLDPDSSLTSKGFVQARLLGERLRQDGVNFDKVYSSSLIRTVQTTQTMLDAMGEPNRDFTRVDAIVEQRTTGWRGIRTEELMTPELVAYMRTKASHFVPPQGESYRMVQRRCANWLEDEILYNSEFDDSPQSLRIAIVGHGIATRCILHYILGFDEQFIWKMVMENTSVSRFRFNRGGWFPICINDTAHLRGATYED
ncbi:MAG: histidine phosphatase family protein [Chloroflexota bacterium]|nr:histidine phosphatase family protein [Chloroflexota bacterium]